MDIFSRQKTQSSRTLVLGTIFNKWSSYPSSLSVDGIELLEFDDIVIWSRDEKRGTPTTNLVYIALLEDSRVCFKMVA